LSSGPTSTGPTPRSRSKNRGGSGNKKTGTCAAFGAGSTTQFYVAAITDLIGRRVRVTQDGVTYIRRVVRTGGDADANANAAKLLELYPALPAPITGNDTYEIVRHFLPGGYEWFSLAAMGDEAPLPVRTRLPER